MADEACVAESLQEPCGSISGENGVQTRRDGVGKQNEVPPTAGKECSPTECRCARCRKSGPTPGNEERRNRHNKAVEKPACTIENRAVVPNLQSIPGPLARYLDSPWSEDPWFPKGLLEDEPILPYRATEVAEGER